MYIKFYVEGYNIIILSDYNGVLISNFWVIDLIFMIFEFCVLLYFIVFIIFIWKIDNILSDRNKNFKYIVYMIY